MPSTTQGRLTDVTDEEGGHLHYTRTQHENGEIITEVLSAEGLLTRFVETTDPIGTYTRTITGPNGDQTVLSRSPDKLRVTEALACGTALAYQFDLDPEYRFKYVKSMTETTPAGRMRLTEVERTYQDTDADGVPDRVTASLSVNGRSTIVENRAIEGIKTITSPEGRTVTGEYDPATLLVQNLGIPGLFDTVYTYDDRGRRTAVRQNDRETVFAYDSMGFLSAMTDAENRTTTYDTDDPVGRVTGIHRPDGGTVRLDYDANGNMTVLTNPVDVSHTFDFNKVNLNSAYHAPISGSYSYFYDRDRRLKETRLPSGRTIRNVYDNDRLVGILTPEGNIDLTYHCGSQVASISMGTETIAYAYDGSHERHPNPSPAPLTKPWTIPMTTISTCHRSPMPAGPPASPLTTTGC